MHILSLIVAVIIGALAYLGVSSFCHRAAAALAVVREAEDALVRSDERDRAAGHAGETRAFLAANRRVYEAERNVPWLIRWFLFGRWRVVFFYLRQPGQMFRRSVKP